MHRYEELEKLYYKKQRIKLFLLIGGFVVLIGLIVSLFNFNFLNKKVSKNIYKEVNKKIDKEIKKEEINKSIKIVFVKNFNVEKKDTLNFIVPVIEEVKDTKPNKVNQTKKTKVAKKIDNKKEVVKNKQLTINKNLIVEKKVTIKDLINKFNSNPSYELAIMIGREYLSKNNYKEAKKWSIKANNMDPQRVDSWILFANILIKENKKQKAIKVLETYIEQYGDNEKIKNKLRSIR